MYAPAGGGGPPGDRPQALGPDRGADGETGPQLPGGGGGRLAPRPGGLRPRQRRAAPAPEDLYRCGGPGGRRHFERALPQGGPPPGARPAAPALPLPLPALAAGEAQGVLLGDLGGPHVYRCGGPGGRRPVERALPQGGPLGPPGRGKGPCYWEGIGVKWKERVSTGPVPTYPSHRIERSW